MAHHLSLLFIPLLAASVVAKDVWNIDCGGNGSFVSSTSNLTFEGDGPYVRAGVPVEIQSTSTPVPDREFRTLRSFPSNKKNCYTIPVEKDTKVLVTAWFFYGNYDGKGMPPSFEAHLDGYSWCNVVTYLNQSLWCEAVYVTRMSTNGTSICVGSSADGNVPFVSAIQVRTLPPKMYAGPDYAKFALHVIRRLFTAADNSTSNSSIIRYPDDAYDRRWFPVTDGYTFSRNAATAVNTTGTSEAPPEKLFRAAASPAAGTTSNLTISADFVPKVGVLIYMTMYFTEVSNLTSGGVRSFGLYQDGKRIYDDPIVPPFGSVLELNGTVNATNNTVFDLVPTNGSTLPPLISAMEVYQVVGDLNNGTSNGDVVALSMLQDDFRTLQQWTGDPCLPKGYNWEWISCNSESTPRVTKLFLGGLGLSGEIPDFSQLDSLVTINLQNNKFSGSVPEFLGKFPSLQVLNLADNDFSSIPDSISRHTKLLVNYTGNPKLCNSGQYCFLPGAYGGGIAPAPTASEGNKFMVPWFCIVLFVVMNLL